MANLRLSLTEFANFSFHKYSWRRLWAMICKEFIQMKRDRGTFALIIGIPLIQIILFGYAINTDPKHLLTAIVTADDSQFTRTLIHGMENTDYFTFVGQTTEKKAAEMLATNKVQFVLNIPANFSRDLVRGSHPAVLLEADATDPVTVGSALSAMRTLPHTVFDHDFQGALQNLISTPPAVDVRIHAKYNPDNITQYNTVPGLIGVILTMTMAMITAIAITRERERGTMENLLATPVQPLEVMLGKLTPFILVGYIQLILILICAWALFQVPILGNVFLLMLCAFPFIAANLAVGLTISTIASNQLQATQMATFFFLPSIILSGYIFPFPGMPQWAQVLGSVLPVTHFIRITRGIMLKGNGWIQIWPELWPIFLFLFAILFIGVKRYRRTLD